MANPRIEELPDEPETDKKAQAEDASSSSESEVEGGEAGDGMSTHPSQSARLGTVPTSSQTCCQACLLAIVP